MDILEITNALSIAAPSLILVYYWMTTDKTIFTEIYIVSTWIHMPISFTYHMCCSLHYFKDPINCWMRKLDQSFIHVCCITYSYAFSGSILYFSGIFILNSWYILKLWIPGDHDIPFERRKNIFLAVHLYLLPLLYRKDYGNYFGAILSFVTASFFFVFQRWGHPISHLCYCPFVYFLYKTTTKIETPF